MNEEKNKDTDDKIIHGTLFMSQNEYVGFLGYTDLLSPKDLLNILMEPPNY